MIYFIIKTQCFKIVFLMCFSISLLTNALQSKDCEKNSECAPFEDCVEETCQIPNPELHSCCKTLGVNIECWGICMGDCNESQEVDPIFFMTSCGSFLRDVAVKCCKKVKTSKIRTKDEHRKIRNFYGKKTKDITTESSEEGEPISNALSTAKTSTATLGQGVIESSTECKDRHEWCEVANPDCNTDYVKKNCQKYCGLCADCPPKCTKCQPGKPPSGKDLDENGICHFFCSRWNECGSSPNHEAGQDCRSCSAETTISTEPNKVTLVSIMNGGPTEKINDKVFVKHTFDRISPTDSRLEEEKNPVVDCCKEKEVPKYCLGFCSIRMGGERSMNMNVGLGKCKEHSDTIEMCETSKTGHRMLRNLNETGHRMLRNLKEMPENEQMSVTTELPFSIQSKPFEKTSPKSKSSKPSPKSKMMNEGNPVSKITTKNVLFSTSTVECKNESKPEFAFLRTQLHSKYIKKCCKENLPNNCMKQCEVIDNIDYVSDCSCQQWFKEDAEFMKCIRNREPECSCTDFVNPSGIGFCRKTYNCANLEDPRCVKKFHEKYVCYVNQPTNCEDVTNSQFSKGKKASAVACEKEKGNKDFQKERKMLTTKSPVA